MLDDELCRRLDTNHPHMTFSLRSKRADLEIAENLLSACGKIQYLWSYRTVRIIRNWPRGNPKHALRTNLPDSKLWRPVSKPRSAMNYVARTNHFWIAFALTALAKGGDNYEQYQCDYTRSHTNLRQTRKS
jgi:hypothetical protein